LSQLYALENDAENHKCAVQNFVHVPNFTFADKTAVTIVHRSYSGHIKQDNLQLMKEEKTGNHRDCRDIPESLW